MRKARVFVKEILAGELVEEGKRHSFVFIYLDDYDGPPISLTMPVRKEPYFFDAFPPFFEGLLPEGFELHALLKEKKINKNDYFRQLTTVGQDLVGYVTVEGVQ